MFFGLSRSGCRTYFRIDSMKVHLDHHRIRHREVVILIFEVDIHYSGWCDRDTRERRARVSYTHIRRH